MLVGYINKMKNLWKCIQQRDCRHFRRSEWKKFYPQMKLEILIENENSNTDFFLSKGKQNRTRTKNQEEKLYFLVKISLCSFHSRTLWVGPDVELWEYLLQMKKLYSLLISKKTIEFFRLTNLTSWGIVFNLRYSNCNQYN